MFSIKYKFFKYLIIFFKLYSAIVIFQYFIDNVLNKYLNIFILIYINNLLIHNNSLREYKEYIYKIFKIFKENSL